MTDKHSEKRIARQLQSFYETNQILTEKKHRNTKMEVLEKFRKK